MDTCKALKMIVLMLVILSTANSASICEQSITLLQWPLADQFQQYTNLYWEYYKNTQCNTNVETQFPANFQEIGCCYGKVGKLHWTFNAKEINEKVRLTCLIEKFPSVNPPDNDFGFMQFTSEQASVECPVPASALINITSKTNNLKIDTIFRNFCIICVPGKNGAEFLSLPSKEVNSDEKGKGPRQCDCGRSKKTVLKNRIAHGTDTNIEKYPWMVSVSPDKYKQFGHLCGGSVISRRHVLTAAHCAANQGDQQEVLLGVTNLNSGNGTIIKVKEKVIHEKYKSNEFSAQYDIAILVLARNIPQRFYMPICIPQTSLAKENDQLTLIGWGLYGLNENHLDSDTLAKAHIKLVGQSVCEEIYGTRNFTRENQLCAFSARHSSCKGDSGGPWMMVDPEDDTYNLVAIKSYGPQLCESAPSALTAIHYYYDWINDWVNRTKNS